ncbi:MAG TPA: ATP-binding protein [Chroococcales cyanobacterium]|jgi:signal transduction histidine kinase
MNINPPAANSPKAIQILVVDDETIIGINLKESLESLGYAVPAIAASGKKAIEKATQLRPDLVLMDIHLKGNMDGIAAAQQIWEDLQIPVIFVTGHSNTSTVECAKATASFGYILKPVQERELYVAIETALQRYEREQSLRMELRLLKMLYERQDFYSQSPQCYRKILEDQSNLELNVANDWLDRSAKDADTYLLTLTPIELDAWIFLLVESFQSRAQTQQQNLQVSLPPDLPLLVSDLSALTRILSELINNACKYTPAGEEIVVTAQAKLGKTSSTRCIQISVSNSGVEIPPEELPRIFDPFYRIPENDIWKQGGTGLGLALVSKLVNQLQGDLEVMSFQSWTTFTIEIPNLRLSL